MANKGMKEFITHYKIYIKMFFIMFSYLLVELRLTEEGDLLIKKGRAGLELPVF